MSVLTTWNVRKSFFPPYEITMSKLTNYDDALEYVVNIQNEITRCFVSMSLRKLEFYVLEKNFPTADFDLLFFVKVVERAFSDHDKVRQILDGIDMLWPEV